jgi:hypothetical protein
VSDFCLVRCERKHFRGYAISHFEPPTNDCRMAQWDHQSLTSAKDWKGVRRAYAAPLRRFVQAVWCSA